jgi:hypothetical protein
VGTGVGLLGVLKEELGAAFLDGLRVGFVGLQQEEISEERRKGGKEEKENVPW